MAIESDALVIGGGIAGATAALAAAREGADVRLVSHKESTLRQASGLIDALGYAPTRGEDGDEVEGLDGPLVDPFAALDRLPAEHPYSLVGADALREGLALFDEVSGDLYRGGHTDRNALLPTIAGTVKPTARYPASTAAGLASDDRRTLLVGFRSLVDFDAPLVAERLADSGVPFPVEGVTVEFPASFRDDARLTRLAHALDGDECVGGGGGGGGDGGESDGTPARGALAAAVEPHLDDVPGGAERVGFPGMLGHDRHAEVRADLESRLGVDVFEVPGGPPSLPGIRLADRLFDAMDDAGVRIETGNPVVGRELGGDGRVERVLVDRSGSEVPYAAAEYVLATGGLVGRGIDSDREGVCEPVFGCHVPHPAERYDWFVDDPFGDQPYATFGVRVDASLRPLEADGDVEFPNVRAAGAVLGGADAARENSASGTSLATGLVAGRGAAAEVTE
ncbi:glycerol-3-phosphate dehydrogenase subunit GlpB [Halorarum salinum]|uniref:Glycerol-3-phosphate dehydrogenase subunit GlpB n=1 Tax=Halorarum salinum TaxID=2743089 RepID=A0A7D5L907_9EURY|nr:glycerol-3-phosphate dehydrogenase subunit GlpB [Halobaculum salinum]QLG60872.1 glycerol-3-phosphate dehydrogenase subunit GlpB [Halobaculum salinum]